MRIMRLTINIPDPPKNQCITDISFHFQDGQLVEYTAPFGWVIKEQPKTESENKKYEAKIITRGKCMMCGKELTEGLFFCKECRDKANSRK